MKQNEANEHSPKAFVATELYWIDACAVVSLLPKCDEK